MTTSIEQSSDDGKTEPQSSSSSEGNKTASVTKRLVKFAEKIYQFGIDTDGNPFGVRNGGHIARPLTRGRQSIEHQLAGKFFKTTGIAASQKVLTEAMTILSFKAEEKSDPVKLHLRVARPTDEEIYVDMGDKAERVMRIAADGWEILDGNAEIPVLFKRTNLTRALPMPERGGDIDHLWQFVNIRSESDRELLKGWLAGTYVLVDTPCPLLALMGEQGTAKTSSIRRTFSLFDPTDPQTRRPPSDADRLLHSAGHARSIVYDNLSRIQQWLSDGMCRLVTGEGDVDRMLYTDSEPRIIQIRAVLGFTAIDVGALNSDLAERAVWGNLEVIPASERRSEQELNAAWDEVYPSMVAGLLDLVVQVLQNLPKVQLAERPRMADFAEVLAAMDLGTGSESLAHYMEAQASVASEIVDTDKFLTTLTDTITQRWSGTGKALYEMLPQPDDKYRVGARGMAGKLRRIAPDLRKAGWQIDEIAADPVSKRAKTWVLVPPNVGINDSDLARLQLAYEAYDRDFEAWTRRVIDNGATHDCAPHHAEAASNGMGSPHCQSDGCQFPRLKINPAWSIYVERSKLIDEHLGEEMTRTRIDRQTMDKLIAAAETPR